MVTAAFSTAAVGLLVWVSGCSHSAPFVTGNYLTDSVRVSGPFALLTDDKGTSDPAWNADGQGFLYHFLIRPPLINDVKIAIQFGTRVQLVLKDSMDVCVGMFPATGGNRHWTLCDTRDLQWDSVNVFGTTAIAPNGRLLYQEAVGRTDYPLPVDYHVDFWLADTSRPFTRRRLLALYTDSSGIPRSPPTTVNWVEQAQWLGADSFLVIGRHILPDSALTTLGLGVGRITDAGADLQLIPGTAAIQRYAIAPGGRAAIFTDGTLQVWRAAFDGGMPVPFVTIPAMAHRSILDIACTGNGCRLLVQETVDTVEGRNALQVARSWIWSVSADGSALQQLMELPGGPRLDQAALAPVANSVVGRANGELYLIRP